MSTTVPVKKKADVRQVSMDVPRRDDEPTVNVELRFAVTSSFRRVVAFALPASVAPKLAAELMRAAPEYIIQRRR